MERNQFKQKWNEFKHKMRNKWNKLTDADISEINGDYDRFIYKMERHGYSRDQAQREFQNWHMEGEGRMDRKEGNMRGQEYGRSEEQEREEGRGRMYEEGREEGME